MELEMLYSGNEVIFCNHHFGIFYAIRLPHLIVNDNATDHAIEYLYRNRPSISHMSEVVRPNKDAVYKEIKELLDKYLKHNYPEEYI